MNQNKYTRPWDQEWKTTGTCGEVSTDEASSDLYSPEKKWVNQDENKTIVTLE